MYDPQDVAGLEEETVNLYMWAEVSILLVLRDLMRERLKSTTTWGAGQALAIARKRREIRRIINMLDGRAPRAISAAIAQAYSLGHSAAMAEVSKIPQQLKPAVAQRSIDAVKQAQHAREAIREVAKIHRTIPGRVDSIWRQIVHDAVNLGDAKNLTVKQSAQYALTRFTKEGLPFYVDKAGRRWGIDTYAEMAVRTATNNAMRDAYAAGLQQSGIDLVIVSSHRNPAPVCAPFERQVLSLTGKYPAGVHEVNGRTVHVKATLNEAVRSGLYHPNCRHRVTAFIPGYTSTTKTTPPDPEHKGYQATQQQRYYERQIRASLRMEQVALDEQEKRKAIARRKLYQSKLTEHVKKHDLPRRWHRERLMIPDESLLLLDR